MASFTKLPSGNWRVTVSINGKRPSKVFKTKQEGMAWALSTHPATLPSNKTFGDLLIRYRNEVSANKKGRKWEEVRINKYLAHPLAKIKLSELSKSDFASWRDERIKEVSNLSVLREWALLSHAIEIAIREWDWMKENPMKALKKPVGEPPRDRLVLSDEISRLCHTLSYDENVRLQTITQRVGGAFMFALETALRAQEICNLRWDDINGRVAKINASKTLAGVRKVPLSAKAMAILEQLKGIDSELVFNIKTSQLDSLFRKAKKQALIENLHFHDSRHQAITNLAKKLDVLELARVVGHKDLNMLLVYYNESAENIAKKLD